MKIDEIETKLNNPLINSDLRKFLDCIYIKKLHSKLVLDRLIKPENNYYEFHSMKLTEPQIIEEVNAKINEHLSNKSDKDNIVCFIKNASAYHLYLFVWTYSADIVLDDIIKKAKRYANLGAMI